MDAIKYDGSDTAKAWLKHPANQIQLVSLQGAYDFDGDGVTSKDEFRKLFKATGSNANADLIFDQLDTDRSGFLTQAEIKALGLEDHVYLTGILHAIAPLLNASTLAVLPSLIEPLGMFQIEAQYLGVPTIASRVGGIPETILHEETGLMVEPGKVRAWADAICWVLQHPTEAKQMAERGKAFVTAKFSMERNTVELIKLIQA